MLGNFTYCNPTKLYFGQNALDGLNEELPKYGKNVLLVYGGGSIKKNGIYDKVVEILKANGKEVYEDAGVMPNPTVEKLNEGMWIATWALNTLVAKGKTTDWMVHMLGQGVAAHTDATHGMTLAAVSMPYYRYILPYGTAKFARYAENVWNVNPEGKTEIQVANEGLDAMEAWMKKIGLVMNITELGAAKAMLDGMVKSTLIMDGGYKVMDADDIRVVLQESF